jgi:TP901 family phage tail tape measure protein
MSLNQLGLGFIFTAKDEASEVIERLEHVFGGLEEKAEHAGIAVTDHLKGVGKGAALAGIGAAVAGISFEFGEHADHLVGALEQAKIAAGETEEEFELLEKAALRPIFAGTGGSAITAAEALRDLTMEGLHAEDATRALSATTGLLAISMGQLSTGEAAGIVVDTLREFRLGAESSGALVDKLVVTMRSFGLRAAELRGSLQALASGAALSGASLDDTLVTFGLVKSVFPNAQKAAMAVNVAFQQLASEHTRKELAAIGVQVADSSGKMRPLIEILQNLNQKTAGMTEAQRSHQLASVSSARAAGGLAVIMDSLRNGIRGAHGEVLAGSAAIEELRRRMDESGGATERAREELAGTFEGAMKRLRNAVSNIGVEIGLPFLEVFTPLIRLVGNFFTAIAQLAASIPSPVKKVLATITLITAGVLGVAGAFIAFQAAIPLIGAALVWLGGIFFTMLPIIAVFAAIGLAAAGLYVAFKNNFGGIGDFFGGTWEKVKLFFKGMLQLFQEGGFSGEVMAELGKAENQGVKNFAIKVFMWIERIKNFFSGLIDGFKAGIERLQPVFDAFGAALRDLGEAFGFLGDKSDPEGNALAYDDMGRAGSGLGNVLATLASVLVGALTVGLEVAAAAVELFREAWMVVGPAVMSVWEIVSGMVQAIGGILTGDWSAVWLGAVHVVFGAIRLMVNALIGMIEVAGRWADKIADFFGFETHAEDAIRGFRESAMATLKEDEDFWADMVKPDKPAQGQLGAAAVRAAESSPALASFRAQSEMASAQIAAYQSVATRGDVVSRDDRPLQAHISLNVDGETLARATAKARRGSDARAFVPVPAHHGASGDW